VVFGGRRCLDAVLRAGGEPLLLAPQPMTRSLAMGLLRRFDGLMLMGGADVDPRRFGQEPHESVYGVNPEHDEFELALATAAMTIELPTLALCRGMQISNVANGGTLHQHLADLDSLIDHGPPNGAGPSEGVLHHVAVESGSRLAKALNGHEHPLGNSFHHQSIDRVGEGFSVVARAEDGVIEAIEHDAGWYVGVQWHPEDTAMRDPVQQRLFDAFVEQAHES
jgi:putative glutamine amidotransferase